MMRFRLGVVHATSREGTLEEKTRHVLSEIFAGCALSKVGVRLWRGAMWPDEQRHDAVLALNHPERSAACFCPGQKLVWPKR